MGRLGLFPAGLEAVAIVDYFAVGNRVHCYHQLSLQIAQLDDVYAVGLIEHLSHSRLLHWDPVLRELAAEALGRLAPLFPRLLRECLHSLVRRHMLLRTKLG